VVYFGQIEEENRKITIQITVNVETPLTGYSTEVNRENKFETLIKYYGIIGYNCNTLS